MNSENKEVKPGKEMRLFKKLTAIPYLLVVLTLLMPLATVSCNDDKVIAEPNVYELASGLDLKEALQEPARGMIVKMETNNPKALERFRTTMPNFPKMEPMPSLYVLVLGAIIAAVFALFTPLGSIAVGMLTMVSMGAFLAQLSKISAAVGVPMLKVEPGIGLSAATVLIFIGTAMNLATIARPIVDELRRRHAAKKNREKQA